MKNLNLFLIAIFCHSLALYGQDRIKIEAVKVDTSFDSESEKKLNEALELLSVVLNSREFDSLVHKENFNVGSNGLSNDEIFNLFVNGNNNYRNSESDFVLNFNVSLFNAPYKKTNNDNFGVTDMKTRVTRTHRCFVLNNDVKCYASHLMHEYMHQIGFTDKRRFGIGKKTHSVPYKIGRIVDSLLMNDSFCNAQNSTCTKN